MAEQTSIFQIFNQSLEYAWRLTLPSLPYGLLFTAALGGLIWAANALPDGGVGFAVFSALTFATLFAHSLYSVSMYHAVLPAETGTLSSAWKLSLAWILVIVIAAIAASMITLFFALIGASLGVGTSDNVENISDMTAQMRDGGTFWPLFVLFLATLFGIFWFAVRIMTFAAATASRGRVHVLRTWYWTKGHFRRLAPLMLILVAIPILILTYLGTLFSAAIIGAPTTPVSAGLSSALTMLILLPSAWLGHGFAATVFETLAPEDDQITTPES